MAMHRSSNGIDIGSTLSQVALGIRMGKDATWVRRQGLIVRGRGETWEANYYNGGRLQGYELIAIITHDAMLSPPDHIITPPARRAAAAE